MVAQPWRTRSCNAPHSFPSNFSRCFPAGFSDWRPGEWRVRDRILARVGRSGYPGWETHSERPAKGAGRSSRFMPRASARELSKEMQGESANRGALPEVLRLFRISGTSKAATQRVFQPVTERIQLANHERWTGELDQVVAVPPVFAGVSFTTFPFSLQPNGNDAFRQFQVVLVDRAPNSREILSTISS